MTDTQRNEPAVSTLWILLFTVASVATSLLFACATPFTALAALAATQMRRRDGLLLMLASWAAGQTVDVCVHHYPMTGNTIGWAGALALAAVAATIVARAATGRVPGDGVGRIVIAYLVAMVAFKAVILVGALGLHGGAMAFAPKVLAREFVRNGAILAVLYAAYRGLLSAGLPPAAPVPRTALA